MSKSSSYINQHLINLVIDQQFSTLDKNNLHKYKKIYLILKIKIFFKSNFFIFQQLTLLIKIKINLINNERQTIFISRSINVIFKPIDIIPNLANVSSLILPIR